MRRLDWVFGGFFVVACVAALAVNYGPWKPAPEAQLHTRSVSSRWGKDYLPNVPVVDQNGKTYRFYDDLVKGKKVILNFIYTSCSDICPMMTGRMALLQKKLGDMVGRDVFIYSMTVDPEHDGPKELKRYADTFQVGPGWLFLTGKPDDMAAIRNKLGERIAVVDDHRNEMLLGNEARGDWFKVSSFEDIDSLASNVYQLDPNYKTVIDQSKKPADLLPKHVAIESTPGQGLFLKMCAMCHSVGQGDRVGPDLMHVRGRHNLVWLTSFLKNPASLIRRKDPEVMELVRRFPVVRMPVMGIGDDDISDLLTYIETVSNQVDAYNTAKQAQGQQPEQQGKEPEHQSN